MNPNYKTLSHVGVHCVDLEASLKFYVDGLGCKEAFRLKNHEGRVSIIYLLITPTTFVELFTPREGMTDYPKAHFSIETTNLDEVAEDLKRRLPPEAIRNPNVVEGSDGARMFILTDPAGNWVEFQEFPPGSKQAQAIQDAAGSQQ